MVPPPGQTWGLASPGPAPQPPAGSLGAPGSGGGALRRWLCVLPCRGCSALRVCLPQCLSRCSSPGLVGEACLCLTPGPMHAWLYFSLSSQPRALCLSAALSFLGPVFLSPSLCVWLGVGLLARPSLPSQWLWSPTPGSLPLVGVGLVCLLSPPLHPCLGLIWLLAHPPHPSLSSLRLPESLSASLTPFPLPTSPFHFSRTLHPSPDRLRDSGGRLCPFSWGRRR